MCSKVLKENCLPNLSKLTRKQLIFFVCFRICTKRKTYTSAKRLFSLNTSAACSLFPVAKVLIVCGVWTFNQKHRDNNGHSLINTCCVTLLLWKFVNSTEAKNTTTTLSALYRLHNEHTHACGRDMRISKMKRRKKNVVRWKSIRHVE